MVRASVWGGREAALKRPGGAGPVTPTGEKGHKKMGCHQTATSLAGSRAHHRTSSKPPPVSDVFGAATLAFSAWKGPQRKRKREGEGEEGNKGLRFHEKNSSPRREMDLFPRALSSRIRNSQAYNSRALKPRSEREIAPGRVVPAP